MPLTKLESQHISAGRMLDVLNAEIQKVGAEVIQNYNNHGDIATAKGKVTLIIDIQKDPKYNAEHFNISWKTATKLPETPGDLSLVTAKDGSLHTQASGADHSNPKQESLLEPLEQAGN